MTSQSQGMLPDRITSTNALPWAPLVLPAPQGTGDGGLAFHMWIFFGEKYNNKTCIYFICPHLSHWGRVTHICISNFTIIGSDNGLSPFRCQVIIWTNARISLIGSLGINFSETLIKINTFSLKKMCLNVSSVEQWPFCHGINVLNGTGIGHPSL